MKLDSQPNVSEALIRLLGRQIGADRLKAAYEADQITVQGPWPPSAAESHRISIDGEVFEVDGITLRNEIYEEAR